MSQIGSCQLRVSSPSSVHGVHAISGSGIAGLAGNTQDDELSLSSRVCENRLWPPAGLNFQAQKLIVLQLLCRS